jgi:hypothetical protein
MRELSMQEVESVNGGLSLEQGEAAIGVVVVFAAIAAPAAAAFGVGVLAAIAIGKAFGTTGK